MNKTIKNIKLGAPESITVNNCGTLENLDIQITERLESVIMKGDTGTKNPIERVGDLLKQQDIEMNKEEDSQISISIPDEAILNGGNTKAEVKQEDVILPSKDFYWQLQNINPESTGHPTIDQRGNITIESNTWAEFDVKVKRYEEASWSSQRFILNQNIKG